MEKIALVTGSTNNVGKAIAEALSRDGFTVIVTSRHEKDAEEVAAHLAHKGNRYCIDFASAEQITRLFEWIRKTYGRLDVLVTMLRIPATSLYSSVPWKHGKRR